MDIHFNEKKMGDRSVDEDVQIVEAYINKGKF